MTFFFLRIDKIRLFSNEIFNALGLKEKETKFCLLELIGGNVFLEKLGCRRRGSSCPVRHLAP